MKKLNWLITIITLILLGLIFASGTLLAKPLATRTFDLPEQAKRVSDNVYFLGKAIHQGKQVEGLAIIDYKKGFGKPTGCNNDGKCQGWEDASCADCAGGNGETNDSCYGFLAKGAKWKVQEPYLVDSENSAGLTNSFVSQNLALDIDKWETAAGAEILGNEVSGTVDGADTVTPDNKNEVYFADIGQANAIGVTIVWGIFSGPPWARELVEWDQIYDDQDFDWSDSGEVSKMDFENIATHELGHSVGLDDLYTSECSEQTMYGYATEGETKKRTLEAGDIRGVQELYR